MSGVLRSFLLTLIAGVFGIVFGLGLVLSHMVDPKRVADFLDVTGNWNPALAFVMGGAIIVAAPAFWYARHHKRALLGTAFDLPDRFRITGRLVGGAALFGIGWGLSGICPGPGIVLAGSFEAHALIFVGAVIAGSLLSDFVAPRNG
jgi:uncharacterized membrane protein YedE/YeeE